MPPDASFVGPTAVATSPPPVSPPVPPLAPPPLAPVTRLADDPALVAALQALLTRHGLRLQVLAPGTAIPGSYWGDDEAGLIGDRVLARPDTPVHSVLHEACHWLCMDAPRRARVHTDAGGTDTEEHAVCYLQALLADALAPHYSRARLFADMDAWGYHFILGSARAWFDADSDDAQGFLRTHGLMTAAGRPTFGVRR